MEKQTLHNKKVSGKEALTIDAHSVCWVHQFEIEESIKELRSDLCTCTPKLPRYKYLKCYTCMRIEARFGEGLC